MLLYIMLDDLMVFVCIVLIFWLLTFANAFCFHALSWVIDTICLFQTLFHIILTAFNMLVFLISCSHRLCVCKGYVLSGNSTYK